MIIVFDASVLASIVVQDVWHDLAMSIWDVGARRVTSTLADPEVASAIRIAHRRGDLSDRAARTAAGAWRSASGTCATVALPRQLAVEARERVLASARALRGADAVYVAMARALVGGGEPVALASFDGGQRAAAVDVGLTVVPAVMPPPATG